MLVVCDEWDRRECQTPGTPILNHVRPSRLFLPDEGRMGVNGLGVTSSRAYSSQLRDRLCENRADSTGSDYCSVAWGGQAAIVGLVGIAPFPA